MNFLLVNRWEAGVTLFVVIAGLARTINSLLFQLVTLLLLQH
jgi:hypothetical protein